MLTDTREDRGREQYIGDLWEDGLEEPNVVVSIFTRSPES